MSRIVAALVVLGLTVPLLATDDLAALSDEFDDGATLSSWSRVRTVEGWNADPLRVCDINKTRPGVLVMQPYTSTWYRDFIGELLFKAVTGDFVVTSSVRATGIQAGRPPQSSFSLGSIMLRAPREISRPQAQWRPGGENYVFLSLGHADNGMQYEVKTTVNSDSQLHLSPAAGDSAVIRLARIGDVIVALLQPPGEPWRVMARYSRRDFPETLQVGPVTYTDYAKASTYAPLFHNSHALSESLKPDPSSNSAMPFRPDLNAEFDYVRFTRPAAPPSGRNIADPNQVSDAELIAWLGQ